MSVPGAKIGDAWIGLSVDASKVGPEMEASVDTALAGVVGTADTAMAEVATTAEAAAAKVAAAFDEATAAQQRAWLQASAAAENASARVVAAQNAQRDAIAAVTTAEAELEGVRAKGNPEAIAVAEANLARARGKGEVAAARLAGAEATEAKTRRELVGTTEALGGAEEKTAAKGAIAADTIKSKWLGMASLVGGATAVMLVKSAGDYQQQLTKLATTAGESTGNLKLVGDGMLKMAGDVGVSAQHLSVGMYTVESAGFHGADGLTVLKAAAQGARQEGADLGKVTDAVTTALHDYGYGADKAGLVTSQMIDAVSHGKTTFDALTGSMHSVTPLAASMGMSFSDVTGSLSAMTASGMSADQASQNLADALRHLQTPTAPMTAELAQLGITSSDLAANLGKKGLAGTVQEISAAIVDHLDPATKRVLLPALNQSKIATQDLKVMMASMPPSLRASSQALLDGGTNIAAYTKEAKGLGGHLGPMATQFLALYKGSQGFSQILKSGTPAAQTYTSALQKSMGTVAGLSVALQLTGDHADTVNASIKDIAGAVPQADGSIRGWSEVQGNFNQKLAQTWAAVQSWAIQMGQVLLPAATAVIGAVKSLLDFMGRHTTTTKILLGVIGGLTAAFLVYKTTVGAIAMATKVWEFATAAATVVQGLFGAEVEATNLAMEVSPIGLIVTLLAGLVIGVIYAWNHFAWFRGAIEACWHALETAGKWIGWLAGVIWGALGAALDWVKGHWVLILELLTGPIGWAIAFFTTFGPTILRLFGEAWKKLTSWLTGTAGPALAHFFEALPGQIGRGLAALLTAIVDWGVKTVLFFVTLPIKIAIVLGVLAVKVGQAFMAAFDYLKTNVPIWIGNVLRFFSGLPGRIWTALVAIHDKLHDAFWKAIDYLRVNVPIWWAAVLHFFEGLPGKIWNALVSIRDKLHTLFWNALDAVGAAVRNGLDSVVGWFGRLPGRLMGLGGSMLSAGGHLISSLLNGLGNAGGAALDVGRKVVNSIIGFINGHVIDNIDRALNFSVMGVNIHAGVIPHIPMLAQGGIIDRPTLAIVGEDGPEAVVPLSKPHRAADVMAAAGLHGRRGSGGGASIHVTQNITGLPTQTAAQAAAIWEANMQRALALGSSNTGVARAIGVPA